MSSRFSEKLASVRVGIEVKEGRVIVSGREYFSEHALINGFEKATINVKPGDVSVKVDFVNIPNVYVEGTLVKVGEPIPKYFDESRIIRRRPDNELEYIELENVDIKIRDNGSRVNVALEGMYSIDVDEVSIDVNKGDHEKPAILNVLTRPFISIWLYLGGRRKLVISKEESKIYISINKG